MEIEWVGESTTYKIAQAECLCYLHYYADGLYWGGDEALAFGIDFHAEAYVDAAHFAEAAAERGAGQTGGCQFGKELSAAKQNFAAASFNDRDFVLAVPGADGQLLHVFPVVDLQTVLPRIVRPRI